MFLNVGKRESPSIWIKKFGKTKFQIEKEMDNFDLNISRKQYFATNICKVCGHSLGRHDWDANCPQFEMQTSSTPSP